MKFASIITLISLITFVSCSKDKNEINGSAIEIVFLPEHVIEDLAWIEIDGVRITHYTYANEGDLDFFSAPASYISLHSSAVTIPLEPYPYLGISSVLGGRIDAINKREELTTDIHDYTYNILNYPLMLAFGIIRFDRSDGGVITIRTSDNYPLQISVFDPESLSKDED